MSFRGNNRTKRVESGVFYDCSDLTSIDITSATYIGDMAFQNCTSLTMIQAPAAESIGSGAFEGCSGVKFIDLRNLVYDPSCWAFTGIDASNCTIIISPEEYKTVEDLYLWGGYWWGAVIEYTDGLDVEAIIAGIDFE